MIATWLLINLVSLIPHHSSSQSSSYSNLSPILFVFNPAHPPHNTCSRCTSPSNHLSPPPHNTNASHPFWLHMKTRNNFYLSHHSSLPMHSFFSLCFLFFPSSNYLLPLLCLLTRESSHRVTLLLIPLSVARSGSSVCGKIS